MKFFVKGVCNKACNRAHKLTSKEERILTHSSKNAVHPIFNKGQRRLQLPKDTFSAPTGKINTNVNNF
jgi:hypothetical protein